MNWFQPIDRQLLFTKNDKEDPRLGECVHLQEQPDLTYDIALLGYADDEGISLNGGRPGARLAPTEIRRALYKMTPHLLTKKLPRLLDLGDLDSAAGPLADRHEQGRLTARKLARQGLPWISLGGGHDYGYCDGAGFLDASAENAVLLNFDAHMDVRPTDKGFNSGTPFHRILTEFAGQVDFAEIGIQNQCNSRQHVQWAENKGATIFTLDQVQQSGLLPCLQNFMQGKEHKKVFISLDIDAFTCAQAPGCSQSWTTGLEANSFLQALNWLVENFSVSGLGIYEVSPPLDYDNHTSKLAALVCHHFIFAQLKKAQP